MSSLQITGQDAADIALALLADRLGDATHMEIASLRTHWRGMGLRLDDLIQGLIVLARDGRLKTQGLGDDAAVYLSSDARAALAQPGQGLIGLPPALRLLIEQAAERASQEDNSAIGSKHREGFG